MDKAIYLETLKTKLDSSGYDDNYSNICLTYANRLLTNNLPVIFDIRHLSLLLGIDIETLKKMIFANQSFYVEKTIPKKSGGNRCLLIPSLDLKYIQRWILDNILGNIRISPYATGFCNNKSIIDNAIIHLNKECVLNMDIKDFFPSITSERVFRIFAYYGYTKEISFVLSRLCTCKDMLPQGSPASPYLSNIVCLRLDKRLSNLAENYNAAYSRYADDITFSGNSGIRNSISIINKIIKDEGFKINNSKTRVAYKHQRQEVTGIIVNNEKAHVNKHYKRKLYQDIYYCKKYGVVNHMKQISCDKTFYKDHLYGRALFVNMIEPEEGKKLFSELNKIDWDY